MIAVTMVVGAIVEPDRVDADARRRDRLARLLRQLALHLRRRLLLRPVPAPLAVHPPLVALGRGAVLPLLAARLRRRDEAVRARPGCCSGSLAGALASVALAWILFDPGGDASRVYYGTDTHAVGLLAGVALALVWSPIELRRRRTGPLVGPILDVVGVFALGFVVLSFVNVHDYDLGALARRLPLAGAGHGAADRGARPPRRAARRHARPGAGALARAAQLQLLPLALAGAGPDPARGRRRPADRGCWSRCSWRWSCCSPTSPTATSSCPSAARAKLRSCPRAGCGWRGRR